MFDGKAFGQEVVSVVKEYLDRSLVPVIARLAEIEERMAALPIPKDGANGKSITPEDVAPMIQAEVAQVASVLVRLHHEALEAAIKALPPAPDVPDVEPIIAEKVAAAVAALPVPADGKDVDIGLLTDMITAAVTALPPAENGKDADPELIRLMVAEAVTALPPAKDGKDIDPEVVKAAIVEQVDATLGGWERPQDGKSVTAEELRPLIEESAKRAVSAIPVPKDGADGRDGADVVDLLIDREGALVATLSNGKTKTLGPVVGKDGSVGIDGKDGASGKDGEPGLGFDDMTEELAGDGRTIIRRYTRGDQVKEFRHSIAVVLDRGVFKEGSAYVAGDGVTWAGSFWIAQDETTEKPDTGKGWRLAVKRGRDGKDGRMLPAVKAEPVKVG